MKNREKLLVFVAASDSSWTQHANTNTHTRTPFHFCHRWLKALNILSAQSCGRRSTVGSFFSHQHVSQKGFFCFATQHCYSVNTCSALYSMTPQAFGYEFHTTRPHANRLNNVLYRCAEYLGRECGERGDNWVAEPGGWGGFHVRSWFSQVCETWTPAKPRHFCPPTFYKRQCPSEHTSGPASYGRLDTTVPTLSRCLGECALLIPFVTTVSEGRPGGWCAEGGEGSTEVGAGLEKGGTVWQSLPSTGCRRWRITWEKIRKLRGFDRSYQLSGVSWVSMSTLQIGHFLLVASHWSTHAWWKRCMQGNLLQGGGIEGGGERRHLLNGNSIFR